MIEVKEIYNSENMEEFINKVYLRDRAVCLINDLIIITVNSGRNNDSLQDMRFFNLSGAMQMMEHLDIFSNDLVERTMGAVIDASTDKNSPMPQIV